MEFKKWLEKLHEDAIVLAKLIMFERAILWIITKWVEIPMFTYMYYMYFDC